MATFGKVGNNISDVKSTYRKGHVAKFPVVKPVPPPVSTAYTVSEITPRPTSRYVIKIPEDHGTSSLAEKLDKGIDLDKIAPAVFGFEVEDGQTSFAKVYFKSSRPSTGIYLKNNTNSATAPHGGEVHPIGLADGEFGASGVPVEIPGPFSILLQSAVDAQSTVFSVDNFGGRLWLSLTTPLAEALEIVPSY